MMNYILLIIGLFLGLYVWSNIIGVLFAALPLQKMLVKSGMKDTINWFEVLVPLFVHIAVLSLAFVYLKPVFFGTIPAGLIILFSIPKLRREALENYYRSNSKDN